MQFTAFLKRPSFIRMWCLSMALIVAPGCSSPPPGVTDTDCESSPPDEADTHALVQQPLDEAAQSGRAFVGLVAVPASVGEDLVFVEKHAGLDNGPATAVLAVPQTDVSPLPFAPRSGIEPIDQSVAFSAHSTSATGHVSVETEKQSATPDANVGPTSDASVSTPTQTNDVPEAPRIPDLPDAAEVPESVNANVEPPSERQILQTIADAAVQSYAAVQNYSCTMTRQERVGGTLLPRETMRLQFCKRPWSVHLQWIGESHRDREVVYVRGRYGDKIHGREPILIGRIPLKMDPFGRMAMRNSRYPITEAGIGNIVEKFAQAVAELHLGTQADRFQYLGATDRPESAKPLECVRHIFPNGTRRDIYFDPATNLPVLIEAVDSRGELIEYYYYSDIEPNVPQLDSPHAFDPSRVFS